MAEATYEEIMNKFKAPNFNEESKKKLIAEYGSLNNAVIKLTDKMPYDEIEKLEQFLQQDITDGVVVYALEKVITRRRMKDVREATSKSARRASRSALFSSISAIAALIIALCMVFGYKGCLSDTKHGDVRAVQQETKED